MKEHIDVVLFVLLLYTNENERENVNCFRGKNNRELKSFDLNFNRIQCRENFKNCFYSLIVTVVNFSMPMFLNL